MAILSPAIWANFSRMNEKLEMSSRELIASKISQKVLHNLIPDAWPGTVGAIFERSLNVEMEDDFLIHMGIDSLPLTPRSILLREEDFYRRLRPVCFPGQSVFIKNGSISLAGLKVNLTDPRTRLYDPQIQLSEGLSPFPEILNRLVTVLKGIEKATEKFGKPSFSPFRNYFLSRIFCTGQPSSCRLPLSYGLSGGNDTSVKMKEALWQKADGFLNALSWNDWAEAMRCVHGLIGLGPGLTPSGDDFLAGFILAGIILGARSRDRRSTQEANLTSAMVKEKATGRTTSVSVAMLADSADGEVAEPVKYFFRSLLEPGEINEMDFWSREICRIGASSGEDMLNGLACGILFFHPAPCDLKPLVPFLCFSEAISFHLPFSCLLKGRG